MKSPEAYEKKNRFHKCYWKTGWCIALKRLTDVVWVLNMLIYQVCSVCYPSASDTMHTDH